MTNFLDSIINQDRRNPRFFILLNSFMLQLKINTYSVSCSILLIKALNSSIRNGSL